ncbi:MATE family efflux transporter [Shewanella intestini]|uniref:MATE family efflux transporter n=1 Tax=Shewanella intestini TaxID=2017544 RepID=A0ABS5I6W1_9GAMM|nr:MULTISPECIES: MATE family efflux transporter [Shewanella]MBR9729573.1 MATE family efflux transporter [Shewanella intestini]MRG37643.1 MATE family efflux transporter [Shewanella sp. XMDDZSB0408]
MNDKHGLLTQPIGRVLLNMTLPNLLGILTVLGSSLVDMFFIGKLGTESLSAVSFTFPVTLVLSSIVIGIGAGLSTNLGRLIGSRNNHIAKVFLFDVMCFTLVIIAALSLLGLATIKPLFGLLGANATTLLLINDYMFYWFLSAPILAILMVGNQALRATGDTRPPAKIMMSAAIVNVILDPILIFGFGPIAPLGLEGAAIATSISWLVALSVSSYLILIKRELVAFAAFNWQRILHNWRSLAHIARPATLMNMINPIANGVIMAMLARVDHSSVAAFGTGIRIESVLLIVVMALSSSLTPFIAQNLGAGQPKRAKQALLMSLKFVFVLQTLLYIPLYFSANFITHLFTSDPLVVDWLNFYLIVIPTAYGALGMVIVFANSLNAYHQPVRSLMLNLTRLILLLLPLAALGLVLGGVKGLLVALPVTNMLMGIVSYILATKVAEPNKKQYHHASDVAVE